jgi:hypothetical protein
MTTFHPTFVREVRIRARCPLSSGHSGFPTSTGYQPAMPECGAGGVQQPDEDPTVP